MDLWNWEFRNAASFYIMTSAVQTLCLLNSWMDVFTDLFLGTWGQSKQAVNTDIL